MAHINFESIYNELAHLKATNIDRTLADISALAVFVRTAENALRALLGAANQSTDAAIKELLTAELGLRNHALYTKTSTEPDSLLNAIIQKRRALEVATHTSTEKKSARKNDLGGFTEGFSPSQFEEIDETTHANAWQAKAKHRDDKRKHREARAEVLREMRDTLKSNAFSSSMKEEDASSPSVLFEQIKRQLRFVPKKSLSWACVLLSVPENASLDFAKSKFRERAKLWHPDVGSASEKQIMTEAMAWLNEAWKIFRQAR